MRTTLGRTGTTRTSRRGLVTTCLTLSLAATLTLSACGTQEVGAAAIVNGTSISDKEVQATSIQLNTLPEAQQKLTPGLVLLNLIAAPYVLAEAARKGKTVPDAEVRKITDKVAQPSSTTREFVRMQVAWAALDEAGKIAALTNLGKAKVTVNPRYGAFDTKQIGLVPSAPNWIKATAAPAAP